LFLFHPIFLFHLRNIFLMYLEPFHYSPPLQNTFRGLNNKR
jgi:hypothetical protein